MFHPWTISILLLIILPATARSNCGLLDDEGPPTELISVLRTSKVLPPTNEGVRRLHPTMSRSRVRD
jgi:hypothetical protein